MIKWHTRAGNLTTNLKGKIFFALPKFSATNILMWGFHVDDSIKGRLNFILGKNVLIALGLNLNFIKTSSKYMMNP